MTARLRLERPRRLVALAFIAAASIAASPLSYTVSGSGSSIHYGIQTHESKALSFGVDYALGRHLGVGFQHRQELSNQRGYKEIEDESGTTFRAFRAES